MLHCKPKPEVHFFRSAAGTIYLAVVNFPSGIGTMLPFLTKMGLVEHKMLGFGNVSGDVLPKAVRIKNANYILRSLDQ